MRQASHTASTGALARVGAHLARGGRSAGVTAVAVLAVGLAGCAAPVPGLTSAPDVPAAELPATDSGPDSGPDAGPDDTSGDVAETEAPPEGTDGSGQTQSPATEAFARDLMERTWEDMDQVTKDSYCDYWFSEPEYLVEIWANNGMFAEDQIIEFFETAC